MTIPELIEGYREYLQHERGLAKATVYAYTSDLRRLDAALGMHVENITRNDLRGFMREMGKAGRAVATIRRTMHGLGTFWRWLHMEGHVKEIVTDHLDLPRKTQRVPAWMSETELKEFIASTSKAPLRDSVAWRLLAHTGIRPDELRSLTIENVNLGDGVIVVRNTKSRRDRVIPLHESLRADMGKLIGARPKSQFVFGSDRKWRRDLMYVAFDKQLKRAGLDGRGFTPYTLRHSFATHLAMSGISIHVLKELLGHKDLSSTQIYLHASPNNLKDAMGKYFLAMEATK